MPRVMAANTVQVSDGTLVALLVAIGTYALLILWAVVDTARRGRPGWSAAVVLLGPVGIVAWIVRRVMDRRSDDAAGIKRPVGV
jgi:hypothetical protein